MPSTYGRPWIDAHAPSSFRTNANAVAAREISGCPRVPSADYIAFAELPNRKPAPSPSHPPPPPGSLRTEEPRPRTLRALGRTR